jgi:hypothetical protein
MWNAFCPGELSGISLQEIIHTPEHCHFLERSFTVRFRCLLDNTSGFLVIPPTNSLVFSQKANPLPIIHLALINSMKKNKVMVLLILLQNAPSASTYV